MEEKIQQKKLSEKIMTIKPNIMNAFFPLFLKYFIVSLLVCLVLFGISLILDFFGISIISITWSIIFFIFLAIIIALIPLVSRIFMLSFTKYVFYETSVIKEFRFIIIKKKSVIYSRITNVSLEISLWDRMCGAGDITLHTDEDEPDVVLKYIKNPEEIEHKIYSLIRKENKSVQEG